MRWVRFAIGLVVLGAMLWTVQRIEWAEVGRSLAAADLRVFGLAAALVAAPLGMRSLRAAWVIRRVAHAEVPFGRMAAVTVFGFSLSSITPGGSGDLLRIAALRPYGISPSVAASVVVFERGLDLAMTLAFLGVALLVTFAPPALALGVGFVSGAAAVGAVALVLRIRPHRDQLGRFLPEFVRRLLPPEEVTAELLSARTFATSTLLTVGVFACEALRPWLVTRSLGLDLDVFGAWAVFTLAWLAGLLSLLPMGIGSWETAAIWAFDLYGVGANQAAAGAVLLRAGVTLPALVCGVASLIVLRRTLLFDSNGGAGLEATDPPHE